MTYTKLLKLKMKQINFSMTRLGNVKKHHNHLTEGDSQILTLISDHRHGPIITTLIGRNQIEEDTLQIKEVKEIRETSFSPAVQTIRTFNKIDGRTSESSISVKTFYP